jgi:hypothetical protein
MPGGEVTDPSAALRRGPAGRDDGLLLFARYAYPPNELGYCGPDDAAALLGYATTRTVDPGLTDLARAFHGPWPYLTLLAGAAGVDDPFDRRVVEAYWVGNGLLDRVTTHDFGETVRARFAPIAGRHWSHLAETIPAGAVAHHSFHVLGVYPWVGLLDTGRANHALEHLDRCRIRWGVVEAVAGDEVTVRYQPLRWDGRELSLGPPEAETVTRAVDGAGFVDDLAPGDWVSMHWHWICDRLDRRQLDLLRRYSDRHLRLVNRGVAHSGPGTVLAGG